MKRIRDLNRRPKRLFRTRLNTKNSVAAVTTHPDRRGKNGKREAVPGLITEAR